MPKTHPTSEPLRKGITDMVRISDARMSGTAYGTVVLHTAPEAAVGDLVQVRIVASAPNSLEGVLA